MSIFLTICFFVLFILGFLFKKSKVIFYLDFIFLFCLLAFRTGGADYEVYTNRFIYYSELSSQNEYLFTFYVYLYHLFNLDFRAFLIISSGIILLPVFFIANKFSVNKNIAISFYMIYPFCVDGIQMRSSLASVFVLFAFYLAIKNVRLKGLIFTILIILASFIHVSTLLFLLFFPIMYVKNIKNLLAIVSMILFIEYFCLYLIGPQNLLRIFPDLPGLATILSHANINSRQVFVFETKSYLLSAGMFLVQLYLYTNFKASNNVSSFEYKLLKKTILFNLISLIIIPLYSFSIDLYRIQRTLILFYYIVISNMTFKFYPSRVNKFSEIALYRCFTLVFLGMIFYMFIINPGDFESTIGSLLFM